MNREVIDCVQGSDEWFAARLGIVTASHFKDVLNSKTGRGTYMMRLVAEKQQGKPQESFQSEAMKNGTENEQYARKYYEDMNEVAVQQVGFILMGQIGCSPDGLVGTDGGIEIKCSEGPTHYRIILADKMPTTHIPQVQGNMWVAGRQWWDFISYDVWGKYKPFYCKRIYRDQPYIDKLTAATEVFIQEMNEINQRITNGY